MMFKIDEVHFGEVKVISPTEVFEDDRGVFSVSFRRDEFKALGLPYHFVQDNYSRSVKNVIRGLHFQINPDMGKLMTVTAGRAFLVAVDFRRYSETFLEWHGVEATAENRIQVWAPAEFLRGFCTLEDNTEVRYKCDGYFDHEADSSIYWNSPEFNIDWPVKNPLLSDRDKNALWAGEYLERTR
jgi:dTDP-4-dehydrorhamnose 3,5-epimerase